MASASIIGIDFGGTKTALALYELPNMTRSALVVVPTDAAKGFDDVCTRLLSEVRQLRRNDTVAIGIGVPGLVDRATGTVLKLPNVPGAEGRRLAEEFQVRTGLPTFVENDSQCFAFAEAVSGAGVGHAVVVGVTLGTGVGGGIVSNGILFRGAHGCAGEFGHMLLKPGQPPYPTENKRGEVEQFLSGTAMGKRCEAAQNPQDYLNGAVCEFMQPHIFEEVAWLVTNLCHAVDPSIIIFGGSAGRALRPHLGKVEHKLKAWMLASTPLPNLAVGVLDDAGVRGAALLAQQQSLR